MDAEGLLDQLGRSVAVRTPRERHLGELLEDRHHHSARDARHDAAAQDLGL
jgi:hypothetical protein